VYNSFRGIYFFHHFIDRHWDAPHWYTTSDSVRVGHCHFHKTVKFMVVWEKFNQNSIWTPLHSQTRVDHLPCFCKRSLRTNHPFIFDSNIVIPITIISCCKKIRKSLNMNKHHIHHCHYGSLANELFQPNSIQK
jgi:hypothetical protein